MAVREARPETVFALAQVHAAKKAIDDARVGSTLNIGAELLPRLSENRKETAAYYTRPVVAELLTQIGLDRPLTPGGRFADTACGIGSLLRAAYRRLHDLAPDYAELASKAGQADDAPTPQQVRANIHREMMDQGIRGLDISRMAAHLTATSLSAVAPGVDYPSCQISACPVGRPDRTGSLELLKADDIGDLLETSTVASGPHGHAHQVRVQDGSLDYYVGNPPYSRARGGQSGWDIAGLSEKEKAATTKRMKRLMTGTGANAQAGLASLFVAKALRKVAGDGAIALVLPSTATGAQSWASIRERIENECASILTVTVAKGARNEDSFSADTALNEMLIAARKGPASEHLDPVHVTLDETPREIWEARVVDRAVRAAVATDEDVREGELRIGSRRIGRWAREPRGQSRPWVCAGARSPDLAFAAAALREGRIPLSDGTGEVVLPCGMGTLGEVLTLGPTHHVIGHIAGNDPIGAFVFREWEPGDVRDTALWKADAKTQKTMACLPTHTGFDPGGERHGAQVAVRANRGRVFFQRGLQYTSQALAADGCRSPATEAERGYQAVTRTCGWRRQRSSGPIRPRG